MRTFLKAEWRKLALANYSVDSKLLETYLPARTEIDLWNNTCYLSLVGFMFKNTRLRGFRIPFHTNFVEVNLRFYVRRKDNGAWKRGVVFIKEIVPRSAISFVANTVYKEKYETLRMSHSWIRSDDDLTVEYKWRKKTWNVLRVVAQKEPIPVKAESEEEFITEHYWGYTRISGERTSEYGVEHPEWAVYKIKDYVIEVDFRDVYGGDFEFLATQKPSSVFLVEGSEIEVKSRKQI